MTVTLFSLLLCVGAYIAVSDGVSCSASFDCAETTWDDSEEESDDVTLMQQMLPMKTSTKSISAHSRSVGVQSRSDASEIHQGDATSFFQMDEVINKGSENTPSPAKAPESTEIVQVEAPPSYSEALPPKVLKEDEMPPPEGSLRLLLLSGLLLVMVLAAGMSAARKAAASFSNAAPDQLIQVVNAMRISSRQEILSMFAPQAAPDDGTSHRELNPGILMRIEGKIVSKAGQAMTTPFSDLPCVMYSASASKSRQDGVHQPPLAYHAAGSDFCIVLEDETGGGNSLKISVHSHDVSLFGMTAGRFAKASAFSDTPETWRGFALAHLIHGVDACCNAMSRVDLGAKGNLEFCECALLDGAAVTCVGEVARDRNGELSLCPWRPPIAGIDVARHSKSTVASLKQKVFGRFSTTSWEQPQSLGEVASPLAGQVLISDYDDFLDRSADLWQQVRSGRWWSFLA